MKLVVAGVEGLGEALRGMIADVRIESVDPADAEAALRAMEDAAAAILSGAVCDVVLRPGAPLDIPVICCVDPTTPPDELRRMTGLGVGRLMFEPVDPAEVARELGRMTGREEVAPPPADSSLDTGIAAIWAEFRGLMVERLRTLERLGALLLEGKREEGPLEEARTAAHKLHGSLGTFGQVRGSEAAAEVEGILIRGAPSEGDVFRYTELVVELRRLLDDADIGPAPGPLSLRAGSGGTAAAAGSPIQIATFDPDPDCAEALGAAALARGWSLAVAATFEELVDDVTERPPDLVVLDPAVCDPDRLHAWLRKLALYPPRVPVVFWTDAVDLAGRLRAAASGVRGVVERERGAAGVIRRAAALLEPPPAGATILVVDDDAATVAMVGTALSDATLRVVGLTDPLLFWETLESVHPDLLLLDMEMPHVGGLQLCRIVRASARWAHLPIVFFTAHDDRDAIHRAFRAGADDYVIKPVVAPELRARVLSRLERVRLQRGEGAGGGAAAAGGHPSSDRERATARAETALAIARRSGDTVAISMVRLSQGEDGDVRVPLSRVAGSLREAARPEDLIARWSDSELVVCLYGMTADAAEAWLRDRIRPHPEDRWMAEVGTASFPGDGPRFSDLVARAALRTAGAARDRAADAPWPSERVDVVLVEDDEALATLLLHTLAARDLTARWIRSGVEAARLMTGRPAEVTARVILLDIGLPGLDGLTVLQRLAESGATARSRVVMLTARTGEAEVLRALELGAFDHVPKPFSVAELMHRVRRALDSGARAS